MWWTELETIASRVAARARAPGPSIAASVCVENGATLDDSAGPITIGERSKICAGAVLKGPIAIGADCLVGNQAMLRGPIVTGDNVRIGYASEIKNALIADSVSIGPMCFVADSRVDESAYLGAMVRTSNHRLDGKPISVRQGSETIKTGREKLGCWIGARAALGIQVIVLPGRVIAPDSTFEPRITVTRNHPQGHYRIRQEIECVAGELLKT